MAVSPQYQVDPVHKMHDTTRNFKSFEVYKTQPTSLHIPGQEHTKVPNILVAQKMPHI